jgi:peroxiredoxin
MRAAGAEVVVVSKDSPAELAELAQREKLGFLLLSDQDLALVDAFGLRHVGADVKRGGDLARPTVLFFDSSGVLSDLFATENWRFRLGTDDTIARIAALK